MKKFRIGKPRQTVPRKVVALVQPGLELEHLSFVLGKVLLHLKLILSIIRYSPIYIVYIY